MTRHELKCWPEFFDPKWRGLKTFDIRLNDRGYSVGDTVLSREYVPQEDRFTGRVIWERITYITDFEQRPGYVVMATQFLMDQAS